MMRIAGALISTILLLGACDERRPVVTDQKNEAEPAIRIANPFHDQLMALSPGNQRIGLMRAVRDTGNRCQRVDNAGYQQEYRNMRMWVATCGIEQRSFAVFIAPNGDVQVRNCADAGRLSLPRCEPLPPPRPDPNEPVIRRGAADNAFRSNSF